MLVVRIACNGAVINPMIVPDNYQPQTGICFCPDQSSVGVNIVLDRCAVHRMRNFEQCFVRISLAKWDETASLYLPTFLQHGGFHSEMLGTYCKSESFLPDKVRINFS